MNYETILFERSGSYTRLTLNRPSRLNSFTSRMHEEFATLWITWIRTQDPRRYGRRASLLHWTRLAGTSSRSGP
jgi:hypothetical protein